MDAAIQVERLSFTYPGRFRNPPVPALVELDLTVAPGEIVGILGPNGSGKTTLFRVLSGALPPRSGGARLLGRSPGDRDLVDLVGYQPEGPLPFPSLSAPEFLAYAADLQGLPRGLGKARTRLWLERLDLEGAGRRAIRTFSTGMARRLALAAALLPDAPVLLLDEPTAGLDPAGSLLFMQIVTDLAAEGRAVLMASHHLQEVEQTCTRVYLLDRGRCRAEGTLDELLGTGEVEIVARGLDGDGLRAVTSAIEHAGGEVVATGRRRRHLFELFRRLRS